MNRWLIYVVVFIDFFCIPFVSGHSGGVQEDDVAPSAPPLDHMDQVYGYETTSFDAGNVFPLSCL